VALRFNGPTPEALVKGANPFISLIFGTTWRPTGHIQSTKIAKCMSQPMPPRTDARRLGLLCLVAGDRKAIAQLAQTKLTMLSCLLPAKKASASALGHK